MADCGDEGGVEVAASDGSTEEEEEEEERRLLGTQEDVWATQ